MTSTPCSEEVCTHPSSKPPEHSGMGMLPLTGEWTLVQVCKDCVQLCLSGQRTGNNLDVQQPVTRTLLHRQTQLQALITAAGSLFRGRGNGRKTAMMILCTGLRASQCDPEGMGGRAGA